MEEAIIEMTLGQKLKQLRENKKKIDKTWTTAYVGSKVGKTRGAISQYENDENKPSTNVLNSLAKLFGVTVDYLLDNDEAIIERDESEPKEGSMISGKKAQLYLSQLPDKEAELYIPYYDVEVTAGMIEQYFDDIEEIPQGYIYAPQYRDCIACNVKGDSMYDRIYPGSRLYVYHLPNLKYIDFGQIFLVVLDGYRLLKYIHPHPTDETKVRLSSYNKHYHHWDVDRNDILNLFLVKGYENQNAM